MEQVVFVIGALICLGGAFMVIASENPVHSALSLVATLFGVAVLNRTGADGSGHVARADDADGGHDEAPPWWWTGAEVRTRGVRLPNRRGPSIYSGGGPQLVAGHSLGHQGAGEGRRNGDHPQHRR